MRSGSECVFVYLELYTIRKSKKFDRQTIIDGRSIVIQLLNQSSNYDEFIHSLLSRGVNSNISSSQFLLGFYKYLNRVDKILK